MKKHLTYCVLLIIGSFLISCSSSDKHEPPVPKERTNLIVSPLQLIFDGKSSESQVININTNIDDWTFELVEKSDWIIINTNSERTNLTISVLANTTSKSRAVVLRVIAKDVSSEVAIIQKSADEGITNLFLVLNPTELTFAYDELEAQEIAVLVTEGAELAVDPLDGWEAIITDDHKSLNIRPTRINASSEIVTTSLTVKGSMEGKELSAIVTLIQKANENTTGFIIAPKTLYFDYDKTSGKEVLLAFDAGVTWTWVLKPIDNGNEGEWRINRLDDNTLRIAPQASNEMYKSLRGEIHFTATVPGKGVVEDVVTIIQAGYPPVLGEVTGYYRAYGLPAFINPSTEVNWAFYFEKTKTVGGLDIILSTLFGHEKDQKPGSQIAIDFPRSGTPVIYPHVTGTTSDGYNLVPMGAELNTKTKTIKLIERCEGAWDGDEFIFDFTRSEGDIEVVVGVFIIDPATGEYKGQITELYSALRLNLIFIIPSTNSAPATSNPSRGGVKISAKPAKLIEGIVAFK